jgi:uncharacterized protein
MKDKLAADLKAAMLSGDKERVSLLQMLKSAILNVEIEQNAREKGLSDEQIVAILSKEAKKREEAALMYEQAGDSGRATKERSEAKIIAEYLPAQMDDEELKKIVAAAVAEVQPDGMKDMGKVIGMVKQQVSSQADGSRIATLVKESLAS